MGEETQEQKDERMSWELFPDIPSHVIQPLPCPFCGAKNIDVCEGTTFRWRQAICRECGGRSGEVRIQTFGDGTQEQWEQDAKREAIEAWNQRPEVNAE